ncbi:membrane protein of unknown function [Legionella fallonii LLAP-10]|uniref:Uncharacterized protein n=2 Tax=Legionella fallonii TaxID=96230 RepID=A0A098GAJ9_9GAMM|nr:membrane protein of unknown function [Legionella fallonii LLAP-10]
MQFNGTKLKEITSKLLKYLIDTKHVNLFLVAFRMLINGKKRFIGMIIGATFSAFIIMQQPSVYQGVTDRLVSPIHAITEPDLWVMGGSSFSFDQPTFFKATDIYRVRSVPGVLWAVPLYRTWYSMKHLKTKKQQNWEIIGVDAQSLIGLPKTMLNGVRSAIHHANAVIIDGYSLKQLETENRKTIQMGDKLVEGRNTWTVAGISSPLRTYMTEPKAYMVSTHIPNVLGHPSFILVKVKPSYDVSQVASEIQKITKYFAFTPSQFADRSNKYFRDQTPIVMGFVSIAIIGFTIGLVMMWQIFNNFVVSHLHQFGMLKMLGVSSSLLMKMVLFQAGVTGGLGYLIGLLLTVLFGLIFCDTVIAFHLTWQIIFLGAAGTTLVVAFASYFGILKVIRLDTVELCRDSD